MDYLELCNEIYKLWLKEKESFGAFPKFDSEFMPEMYYDIPLENISGKGLKQEPIYFLNNNPGGGLESQEREPIKTKYKNKTYEQIAKEFYDYLMEKGEIGTAAKSRLNKMNTVAASLGFKTAKDIEIFFLHSEGFPKKPFLSKKIQDNPLVKDYKEALKDYLKDKYVFSINAIGSKESITGDAIKKSKWLCYVANEILDFNIDKAKCVPLRKNNNNITSAAFVSGKKIMLFTMGGNYIPNLDNTDSALKEIKSNLK